MGWTILLFPHLRTGNRSLEQMSGLAGSSLAMTRSSAILTLCSRHFVFLSEVTFNCLTGFLSPTLPATTTLLCSSILIQKWNGPKEGWHVHFIFLANWTSLAKYAYETLLRRRQRLLWKRHYKHREGKANYFSPWLKCIFVSCLRKIHRSLTSVEIRRLT